MESVPTGSVPKASVRHHFAEESLGTPPLVLPFCLPLIYLLFDLLKVAEDPENPDFHSTQVFSFRS